MALYRDPYARLRELAGTNTLGTAPVEALTPEEMDYARRSAIAARRTESQKALGQGVEQIKSSGLSARGLARIGLGDEAGGLEDLQAAQAMQQAAAEFGPEVQSIDDIDSIGTGLEYVRNMGLQQLPNLALTVGTGGAAGLARVAAGRAVSGAAARRLGAGMAGQVAERKALRRAAEEGLPPPSSVDISRALQDRATRRVKALSPGGTAGQAFEKGAKVAAVAAGTTLQSSLAPDVVLDPEGEGTVRERAGKAAIGALATGALDVLPVMALFKKYGLTGAESAVKGNLLQRVAKSAGTQGTQEAATEVAQTYGERLAHKWVNENVELMSPEAYSEYLNAAAGGFVGGSLFGAPAGIRGSGKDSPAGNRYSESFRGYMGKFKRTPRAPLDPDDGGGPGTAEAPTEDTAFDLGGLGERVAKMTDTVAAKAAPVASKIKGEVGKVAEKFKATLEGLADEDATDNSISEILDAAPFEFTPAGAGMQMLNEGGGVGLFKTLLPDPEPGQPHRIEMLRRTVPGLSMPQAAAMAMLPDGVRSGDLHRDGVIAEAAKLLSGADPSTLDDDKISAFQAALPPEKRSTFNIMAHTLWQGAQSDDEVQIAPEPKGRGNTAAAAKGEAPLPEGMTEEAPLRDTKKVVSNWRAKEGKHIPRGTPADTLMLTKPGKKGVTERRPLSGATIGKLIVEARKTDPEFARMTSPQQIDAIISDFVMEGYGIEPESVKAMKIGKGWMLTKQHADRLISGMQGTKDKLSPERFALRGQTTQSAPARGKTTQQERDLELDPGAVSPDEIVSEAGETDERATIEQKLGPRAGGSPAGLRVTATGKLIEAQTQQGADIDTEAARIERSEQYGYPEKVGKVDERIKAHLGKVPQSFDERDAAINRLRNELKGESKRLLVEHVYEMRRADVERAQGTLKGMRDHVEDALATWKKNKNPQTREALAVARADLELMKPKLQQRIEIGQKKVAAAGKDVAAVRKNDKPSTPTKKTATTTEGAAAAREAAQRQLKKNLAKPINERTATRVAPVNAALPKATEDSMASDPESIIEAIKHYKGTRSRRGLYALKNRIVNSTATDSEKASLLKRVDAQIDALRDVIKAVGDVESSQTSRRNKNAAHFKEVRAKLKNVDKVEAALKAVRDLATPQQKRVIDALIKANALKDVPLQIKEGLGRPGSVDGGHTASQENKGSLSSRVHLAIGNGDPEGQSMDIIGVLLHEAVHAATTFAEQNNAESRKAVEQLLEHARTYARGLGIDPDSMYGLSETQEFLAEAFTNPQLQALLQQIPARNTSKFKTLWDEFKSLVADILGFSSSDASALDEVFAVGLDMAKETGAAREQAYAEIFGDAVDHSPSEGYSAGPMAMTSVAGGMPTDYMMQLNPNERRFLEAAFKRGDVYRQIHDSLPLDVQARLASADEGPSILVNTGIAMAMQGQLDMTYDAKTFKGLIQGLWEQISVVLGVPSRTAYARKVLAQIKAGRDPASIDAEQILLGPASLKIHRYIKGTILPKVFLITRDMDARMRSTGVPALTKLATLMSQRTGEFRADEKQSFNERSIANRNKFLNQYFKTINGWDEARQNAALLELQQKKANPSADAQAVRAFYKDMYDYLREAGVAVGKTEDYFPVSIDPEQMTERRDEMIELLANFPDTMKKREIAPIMKKIKALQGATDPEDVNLRKILKKTVKKIDRMTPREIAERFYENAVREPQATFLNNGQASFATGDHKPTFKEANSRMMDFIYKEGTAAQIAQFATFQDRNMSRVTISYVNRGVRRAEWQRENIGDQIKTLLAQATEQGATVAQITMAGDYVDMMMGSYGTDWHPSIKRLAQRFDFNLPPFEKMQKLNTALTTYQNLRLLPLALASSLIDPLGVAVRSGGTKGVFNAYREAARAIRDQHGATALRRMANDMGLVERHAAVEALMHVYGGAGDPTGRAAKANAFLFRYNGLEMTTRFSRLAALSAGNAFLIHHSQSDSPQSARYLSELGLNRGDIQTGTDGFVLRNEKIDAALNRFVNEAVIRPTPGQRPGWQNDPHFALAAQYKGYLYSFFNTISRRVGVELANDNLRVLLPIAMYLPVTMAGEMLRDMAQGDDEDREMFDYAKLGVERSGLLGPSYSAVSDAGKDLRFGHPVLSTIGGPTGQQIGKAYDAAISGSLGNTAVSALPASSLFKEWGDE